jgi:hypothetical protein
MGDHTDHAKNVTSQHALSATAIIAPPHAPELCPLPAEETGSLPHITFITAQSRFCDYINYAA